MKHLKLFENFDDIEFEIRSICREYGIFNYSINSDGTVDVDGDVDISGGWIEKIPLKFGSVTGDFLCQSNELTTLEGGPKEVGGNFNCSVNELTTLKGAPIRVGGNFDCYKNNLTSLEGAPENIDYYFNCKFNDLISLEGLPIVDENKLYFEENPIWEVYKLFPNMKSYLDSLDYGYLRGNSIDKRRFGEALDELGIKMPKSIPGWKYI